MPRILLVSNRLPFTIKSDNGDLSVVPSAGGLATGLKGPHERSRGLWIGWPGDLSSLRSEQRTRLQGILDEMRNVPIELSPEEVNGFYDRFSNGVLWPLFHYLADRVETEAWDFDTYQRVNERFADCVAENFQEGDLIWVHDYHLALLPGMLRARLPDARIGFFLHIPFPSFEVFRILPWRRAILEGMLGADLIGFHTLSYVRHFTSSLVRTLGIEPDVDRVRYGGRDIQLIAHPMGVDCECFGKLAEDPDVAARAMAIRTDAGDRRILLGIDRLDYTKGVPQRMLTIERLLQRQPELGAKLRVIQVAVPSRQGVVPFDEFRRRVDEIVGRINGMYATPDSVIIHYLFRAVPDQELVALYRAADVMLVTPLRDGMNLVAKEFVASRPDEDGVLILSELAGAADELGEALTVNPYDVDGVASTILRALAMPTSERRARMRALRRRVLANDVQEWAEGFVAQLERAHAGEPGGTARVSSKQEIAGLIETVREASHLMCLLDYDGTLVPFAAEPSAAAPDDDLRELLRSLAAKPGVRVHVLSGRKREDLERWLGDLPLGLHAEHGFWSSLSSHSGWQPLREISTDWKQKILPILEQFAARTPGSLVEEKTASLAWHYRQADAQFGPRQARELRHYLRETLSNMPVEVIKGEKVIEVRLYGVHKGVAAHRILAEENGQTIFAMGDDRTDEDLFAAIPPQSMSVCVGRSPSIARYSVPDVDSARALLRAIAAR